MSLKLKFKKRRPLDDDDPKGYQESDRDFAENNIELVAAFLNAHKPESDLLSVNELDRVGDYCYNLADTIAEYICEQKVKAILAKHTNLDSFVMAMGTWCFYLKKGFVGKHRYYDAGQPVDDSDLAYLKPFANWSFLRK